MDEDLEPLRDARSVRSVLDDLVGAGEAAGDAAQALRAAGHEDLAPELVAEAVVSFAAVAPPTLAEHLAPFVTAHSPAAVDADPAPVGADAGWGLELIATAPVADLADLGDATDPSGRDPLDRLDSVGPDPAEDLDVADPEPLSGADLGIAPPDDVDVATEQAVDLSSEDDEDLSFAPLNLPDPLAGGLAGDDPLGGLDVDPDRLLDGAAEPVGPVEDGPQDVQPSW